jgi:hypothetical protein
MTFWYTITSKMNLWLCKAPSAAIDAIIASQDRILNAEAAAVIVVFISVGSDA